MEEVGLSRKTTGQDRNRAYRVDEVFKAIEEPLAAAGEVEAWVAGL